MNITNPTKTYLLAIMIISTNVTAQAQQGSGDLLQQIFSNNPTYFDTVNRQRDTLKVQVIYTQIDRKKKRQTRFYRPLL